MPRVAYPNEVGISDPDIIEVRISTASRRGKSTKGTPTDHILAVKHRVFGWMKPWEWGMMSAAKDAIDKIFRLIESYLRTEVGVIVFTLAGTVGIIYLFFGARITNLLFPKADLPDIATVLKDFFKSLTPQLPGFPEVPPLDLPPNLPPPFGDEPAGPMLPGEEPSTNVVDAIWGFFARWGERIFNDPLFGFGGGKPPIRINP